MHPDEHEQFFEEVAKACPELMERSTIEYFGVGRGWWNIIAVLCNCIYTDLWNAKNRQKSVIALYQRDGDDKWLADSEAQYIKALEELPRIVQVKEKFGTLRFYVNGGNNRVQSLIDFAEAMSACTCEVCGKPGAKDSGGGWIKTHCNEHQSLIVPKDYQA